MTVRVAVPASSANLGPGYDCFGLALGLYNEFEAHLSEEWSVEVLGEGAGSLPSGADNEVARAAARVFAEIGRPELRAEITCHNGIPVGRGLGSSAAAIVGGLVLADTLAEGRLGRRSLLELAIGIEGHADNVAAALRGGFTISSTRHPGKMSAHIDPAGGLAVLVIMGEHELPTEVARNALPAVIPHADAAANSGNAALVALGIALGVPGYLKSGLHDAIHERYREALIPDLQPVRRLLEALDAGPAVLSGAGPTIIALVQAGDDTRALERARSLAEAARPALSEVGRGRVIALPIDREGARFL
ncbi:MAG: homoserine kinase [Coriobacteriia bacterium]